MLIQIGQNKTVEQVKCPGCKLEQIDEVTNLPTTVLSKYYHIQYDVDLKLMECKECGLFFKNYFVNNSLDKEIYRSFNSKSGSRWAKKLPKKFIKAISIIIGLDKVLEVGPGETPISTYFKDLNVISLEMDQQHISSYPTDLTRTTFQGSIDGNLASMKKQKFDAILIFDVFEHVSDVEMMFKNFFNLLNPGGLIVFETGDIRSKSARKKSEKWKYLSIPEHRVFFCSNSISNLCRKYNFEPILIKSVHHKAVTSISGKIKKCLACIKYLNRDRKTENNPNTIRMLPDLPISKDHLFGILRRN